MPVYRCSIPEPSTALHHKQVCDAPRDHLANPSLTLAFQEVGLEKGRMVTLHPEMALFWGWGTVGRANGNISPPKVLKLCTYLASSPSATRVSKRISLVEEYEEEQMRLSKQGWEGVVSRSWRPANWWNSLVSSQVVSG